MNTKSTKNKKPFKMSQSGRLDIIEKGNTNAGSSDSSATTSRPSSSSRRAPPVSSNHRQSSFSGARSTTPIKEQRLISAKRIDRTQSDFVLPEGAMSAMNLQDQDDDELLALSRLDSGPSLTSQTRDKSSQKVNTGKPHSATSSSTSSPAHTGAGQPPTQSKSNGAEGSEDSSDSSDEEDEERKAPNELIMEFLQCVMANDLENSLKLCKMILLYEPTNQQALNFLPLLEEKKLIGEQEAGASSEDEDGEGEDGEGEDEDSDDDDSEDESDDDSDEETSSEESDNDDNDQNTSNQLQTPSNSESKKTGSPNGKSWAPVAR